MKLRIHRNSLRFRLSKKEVEAIGRSEALVERVEFAPSNALTFRLNPTGERLSAEYQEGEIAVSIPSHVAIEWSCGSEVSIENDPSQKPRILVEKDFIRE